MRSSTVRAFVAALAGLAVVSCGPADEEDLNPLPGKYAAECRTQLAAGNYEEAKLAAGKVVTTNLLADDQPAVEQAAFCYTTANTLYRLNEITKNIESQVKLLAGILNGTGSFAPGEPVRLTPQAARQLADDYVNGRLDPQAAGAIGVFLDSYLGPVQQLLEENAEMLEFIIERGRFQWQIDALPVKIADKKLLDAGGRYDLGEVQLLYGMTRAILGVIYLVQSIDYSISLDIAQYALNQQANNPLLALGDNPARAIANAYGVLMSTSPKFLILDTTVGKEKMGAAGDAFAHTFDAILKAVNVMQKRKESLQAAHVVEFRRESDQDYFVLHMKFENLVPLVDLRKFDGIAIPLREDVLESLENMAKDFSGASGVNTNLQRDVFPLVALTAVVLINSGAFQALIDLAVSGSDPETQETINGALSLIADNPDFILAALVGAVPVDVEMDFGHIFKNPVGLRDILPAWVQPDLPSTKDELYYGALTAATVVYSYECADDTDPIVTGDILCANSIDEDHFRELDGTPYVFWAGAGQSWSSPDIRWENMPGNNFGTLWPAGVPSPKDGITTGIPYIGWKDPSFGGLLYLDVTTINANGLIEAGNGLKKATLQSLNASIASIVSTVETLLE